MIFSYRNGKPITEEEILIKSHYIESDISKIKIADKEIDLMYIPSIETSGGLVYYLQQGMSLYLIHVLYETPRKYVAYIVEQTVEHGKMRIKNIDSYVAVSNNALLLRYCMPDKVNEKENVILGVSEILEKLEFMDEKEKTYLIDKIKEFFAEEPKEEWSIESASERINKKKYTSEPIKIEYDGKTFKSISEFARTYNMTVSAVNVAYRNGVPLDEIIERYSKKIKKTRKTKPSRPNLPFEYNGKTYNTMYEFYRDLKINQSSADRGWNKGLTIDEIVSRYSNGSGTRDYTTGGYAIPITYKGITYKSRIDFCRAYGMSQTALYYWLGKGKSIDEIVERFATKAPVNEEIKIEIKNTESEEIRDERN